MAAVTKLTGAQGVVNIAGGNVSVSDFTISIKRGVASQSRVGKYSDRKIAGKVEVTGSLTFSDIDGTNIARLLNATLTSPVSIAAAATFTLYGDAVSGADRVKVTAANCFFTGASMKFGDADAFIDGPMEFTMSDPDADLTLTYT